jgi:hypothetical protein
LRLLKAAEQPVNYFFFLPLRLVYLIFLPPDAPPGNIGNTLRLPNGANIAAFLLARNSAALQLFLQNPSLYVAFLG